MYSVGTIVQVYKGTGEQRYKCAGKGMSKKYKVLLLTYYLT